MVLIMSLIKTGNDKSLKVNIEDSAGNENFIGVFGEQLAGEMHDDISVQFQYNFLNTGHDVVLPAVTGDGVQQSVNSYAEVSSAVTGTAIIQSKDSIRYRPAHTGVAYFTASFNGASGNGWAGSTDHTHGFSLKYSNDTGIASFGYIKSGVETGTAGVAGFDSEWNGNLSASKVDWTKINIFKITFGYLGVASPTLWIKLGKWYVLHTVDTEGVLDGTHVDTPVFPISIKAENGMTVRTGSWSGGTLGTSSIAGTRGMSFPNTGLASGVGAEFGEATLASTTVKTMALFRSKATYKGKDNKVKTRLLSYEFEVDIPASGNGTVIFQLIGNPTLSGAGTFADIDADNSVMEVDNVAGTGASVNYVSGGKVLLTTLAQYTGANKGGSTGKASIDAERIGAFAYANDTFAVIAKDVAGNNVKCRIMLNWEEHF